MNGVVGHTKRALALRILVVIANFGTKNDIYLKRLLDEYASMSHDVHVVVLTSVPKSLGPEVEVVVRQPHGDPWSFPFAHKKILADRINDFDLFIYSEDDTLITQNNVNAFIEVTVELQETEIAGFLRSEKRIDGATNFSTVHNQYHWDPKSVVLRGPYTLAFFTNEHAAAYILTRKQLDRAIRSGGFLCGSHQEKYDLLVSAATDPYTQCNMKKLVCVSHLTDFVLPHLPSKYVGTMGLSDVEFFQQIKALEGIREGKRSTASLLDRETNVGQAKWGKRYYEPVRQDLLELVPQGCRYVFSYGCGWGALEEELMKKGMDVTAVPLDGVIGACAEARGLKVVYGTPQEAMKQVSNRQFDCIVATDMLHVHPRPVELLQSLSRLLSPKGVIVTSVPNTNQLPILWRRLMRHDAYRSLGSFDRAGLHAASQRVIRKWFRDAGLRIRTMAPVIPARGMKIHRVLGKLIQGSLASEFLIAASKA